MPELKTVIEDWGLIEYNEALVRQMAWVERVQEDPYLQVLIFCTHPPVATLGRKTRPEDLFAWNGPTVEIQRGGRVTYHGPNQLVVYPILNLNLPQGERAHLKNRDLHGYLRLLEKSVIDVLGGYGVNARPQPSEEFLKNYEDVEPAGIWVGDRKLGSIGIGVKKWVTFHGLAVNLNEDEKAFRGMNPCGFSRGVVISLEETAGRTIDRDEFKEKLKSALTQMLGADRLREG